MLRCFHAVQPLKVFLENMGHWVWLFFLFFGIVVGNMNHQGLQQGISQIGGVYLSFFQVCFAFHKDNVVALYKLGGL